MRTITLRQPSKFRKFAISLIRNLPLNPAKLKRQYSDSHTSPTVPPLNNSGNGTKPPAPVDKSLCDKPRKTYETPHPPKDPPDDYCPKSFSHEAFTPPEMLPFSIFRLFSSDDEVLGPSAHKCLEYKNPEYFSYHRFSFVGIQLETLELNKQQANSDTTSGDTTSSSGSTSSDDSDVDCKRELR